MVQLHKCAKKADKDLLHITIQILGSILQLRKDSNLVRAKSITSEQRDRLRHSTMTETVDLFESITVKNVDTKSRQDLVTKGLSAAVAQRSVSRSSKNRSECLIKPKVAKS